MEGMGTSVKDKEVLNLHETAEGRGEGGGMASEHGELLSVSRVRGNQGP